MDFKALLNWLAANWVNVLTIVGGASGYLAIYQAREERLALKREAMAGRLTQRTEKAGQGFLKVAFSFDPPSGAEPYVLRITMLRPKGTVAIYSATALEMWMPVGGEAIDAANTSISVSVEAPLHASQEGCW